MFWAGMQDVNRAEKESTLRREGETGRDFDGRLCSSSSTTREREKDRQRQKQCPGTHSPPRRTLL